MFELPSFKNPSLACDREIQLRMEIVATMRLRALWRNAARCQLTSIRPPAGNSQPADENPSPNLPQSHSRSSGPGEHITRILLISDYDGLRSSCDRLLRKHGYRVDSITSPYCLQAKDLPAFDIAILCQSVECDRVPLLSRVLRDRNPGCCLLRVASLLSGIESGFDLRIDGFGGPAAFLAAIEHLVHRPRKSA